MTPASFRAVHRTLALPHPRTRKQLPLLQHSQQRQPLLQHSQPLLHHSQEQLPFLQNSFKTRESAFKSQSVNESVPRLASLASPLVAAQTSSSSSSDTFNDNLPGTPFLTARHFSTSNLYNGNDNDDQEKSRFRDAFTKTNEFDRDTDRNNVDRNAAYAFVVNSLKNLFNKKGNWTQAPIWRKNRLAFRLGGKAQQQRGPETIGAGMADSLFFPNARGDQDAERRLVLKRRDFLQLFGDRSEAKLEPPWRAVFFGSDDFSVQVLRLLHGAGLSLVPGEGLLCTLDVCTNVGKKGTENPVYRYAVQYGLNVIPYPISKDKRLEDYDVGLLASFGHMIPTRLIQSFPYGILNVHPSLLPRWRGASPCIHTVLNGDTETGVTIMQVAPKHFDIGPIVLQQRFDLPQQSPISASQLAAWMAYEGGNLLLETLERLPKVVHRPCEQPTCGITYAHKIGAETGNVNWKRNLAVEIRRQFLAVGDLVGLKSVIGDLNVTFLDLVIVSDIPGRQSMAEQPRPGSHYFHKSKKMLCIRCLDGWLGFTKVKVSGRKAMSGADFYNGFLSKPALKEESFRSLPNHLNADIFDSRVRRTISSVSRDESLTTTFGHDCLIDGRKGKRFIVVL